MFKRLCAMFSNNSKALAEKKQALRKAAFLAVHDNPIRANGCYGWTLTVSFPCSLNAALKACVK